MNRVQLAGRVTALIERLNSTRLGLMDAQNQEAALIETISQEALHLSNLEQELASLEIDLQQALDDEAYEDSYYDDDDYD